MVNFMTRGVAMKPFPLYIYNHIYIYILSPLIAKQVERYERNVY